MADVTNPEAIRFVNEQVRPMCEKLRAIAAEIDALRAQYDGGIGDYFYANNGFDVLDGREAEGVSRLTTDDVLAFVARVPYDLKAFFDTAGTAELISKPCVRPLRVD